MASDVHPMQAPEQPDRDEEARRPWHLSREWVRRLGGRAWRSLKEHRLGLMSQALAYSALFAVFPGLVALISVYGLVVDPEEMTSAVQALGPTLPGSSRQLLLGFVQGLANTETGQLTVGVVVGFVLALWSASSGTWHLCVRYSRSTRGARASVDRCTVAVWASWASAAVRSSCSRRCFTRDAPNDVAPSAYNEDDPPGTLPPSPLPPRPDATGFRWATQTHK